MTNMAIASPELNASGVTLRRGYSMIAAWALLATFLFVLLPMVLGPHLYFQAKNDSEKHRITG